MQLGRSHIVSCLIGQIWTLPGSEGEGCEPNVRSVLLEKAAIGGAGDAIRDLLDGGEGGAEGE